MAGINVVLIVGHVGKDPDVRSFNSGDKVANFSIATSQTWKDKQTGDRKERTEWHNISVRNQGVVKIVENYVSKGSLVGVFGELQTRKWEKDGIDRYSTEVVIAPFNGQLFLLGGKNDGGDRDSRSDRDDRSSRQESRSSGRSDSSSSGGGGGFNDDLDDTIPF